MLKRDDSRGLSEIVATLLIILLVLVAAGIIWVVVRNVIRGNAEQISLGKLTLDLTIEKVQILTNDSLSVTVKRNQGGGEFIGISFVLEDGENSEVFEENVSMNELERRTFTFTLEQMNTGNITKIKIIPIFRLKSGKEVAGDVKDEYLIPSSYSTGILSSPTCSDGIQNQGETGIDCGGPCSACVTYLRTFYVSNSGDDANNGTSPDSSWRTIAKVNSQTFLPGDAVLFKRGDIWRGTLTVSSSGNSTFPITYSTYGTGNKPIIQPTTQVSSWTQVGSTNVWYATLTTAPVQVFLNDAYVQPAHWPTAVGADPPLFQYPSANSSDATHLTDSDLTGITNTDLIGAQVNIYTNKWTQATPKISAFDDSTDTLTIATATIIPLTTMRYYLTAPAGTGVSFLSKSWMMSENTWFYDTDAQRLYVWKTGGENPGVVEVSALYATSIYISDKDYITIDGFNCRYADFGIHAETVSISTGILILNSEINYCKTTGIRMRSGSANTITGNILNNDVSYTSQYGIFTTLGYNSLVQGNTVTYTNWYPILPGGMTYAIHTSYGDNVIVNNNTVSYCSYSGISFYEDERCSITNNTISHTNSLLSDGGAIYVVNSDNDTVSGNFLTSGTGYGLYVDWYTNNITVENNNVIGGDFGVLMHYANGHIVRGNTLTGPFTYPLTGGAIFINNVATNGKADIYNNVINCYDNNKFGILTYTAANSLSSIYNNDIMNCSTGVRVWSAVADAFDNIKNNIFYNNVNHIDVSSGDVNSIDYNLFYGTGNWIWGGATKTTFDLWKTASSGDANSLNANPLFVSSSNFHLQSGSPAIDKGINVSLPYSGIAPDIGAFEYS